ncbi:alpha/beta fold hydrolase [Bauldia sp.]|uniref:alpha/beta fold hydrolase n=1 Tax=Bauldia sp. TaxID=2575872 RepID=UPI003BAB42B4
MAQVAPRHFVLIHGIWHGGWCWDRVAPILRERGHAVTALTQTGLGERSHLLSTEITVDTFVADLVNTLVWRDLHDVVVVGHSFGGITVTGAADAVPERIAKLIYLDAAIVEDSETWFGLLPEDIAADRLRQGEESSGGLSLPVAPVESFGVTAPDDKAFLEGCLMPHPLGTFTTPVKLNNPVGNGLPVAYIACTAPPYPPAKGAHERARAKGWPMHELATGHDAMVLAPQDTANLIERLGG